MNFDTQNSIRIRVGLEDKIYVYREKLPSNCFKCNGLILTDISYCINGGVKAHKCSECGALFIEYQHWLYMPCRDSYDIVNEDFAYGIRESIISEQHAKEAEKRVKRELARLNDARKKEERAMKRALKEKNGKPLGNLPKQRKRSILS